MIFIGMDVSKDSFTVAVKDDENRLILPIREFYYDKVSLEEFDNEIREIRKTLRCRVYLGLESTGIYHLPLYQHLVENYAYVRLFNGLEMKRFKSGIRKTKTDKLDAADIADAVRILQETTYHVSSDAELIQLRELCRLLDRISLKIKTCKVQARRNIDVLCRGYSKHFNDVFGVSSLNIIKESMRFTRFLKADYSTLLSLMDNHIPEERAREKARAIESLFQNAVVPKYMMESSILELHMLIQQYQLLKDQRTRVREKIEKRIKELDPKILTVPGIGVLNAAYILGELGNLDRFESLNQVTAFAGLDPSVKQSGSSYHSGHISKRGSPFLRHALYGSAMPAARHNPVCRHLYERLKSRGKPHKVCLTAVARKLLHIAFTVEKKNIDFYVPAYITDTPPSVGEQV